MGAQALLLIDPGAELDWAELSDTLPSVVEKAQTLVCTFIRESTTIAKQSGPCSDTNRVRQAMSAHEHEEE